ncbi:cytochrome P450 76T24-like [Nicotiana sylvestris]|uniref:cytochrome P450 76T24-like n=1 Tax=Nicotiana sylvestris TaxID=4096 RepID=UPI00388C9243
MERIVCMQPYSYLVQAEKLFSIDPPIKASIHNQSQQNKENNTIVKKSKKQQYQQENRITRRKAFRNLPPGPPGLPIIGSLLELGSRPNQSLAELAKIHGPLMTLKLGSVTTIVASSPETAKEILHKHDETFSARTVPVAVAAQPNLEATVAWINGDHLWKKKRRSLAHICSLTTDSILSKNFVTKRLQNYSTLYLSEKELFAPRWTLDLQAIRRSSSLSWLQMDNPVYELLMAGSDTSAITMEWVMAELLRNPHELQKVREEILQQIGIERPVKESDIEKLPYLQAVVKETMRLHPTVSLLLPHKAQNDIDVLGYTVPKNTQVLVNAWAIGRDPKSWEKPLEFMPERFIKSSVDYKGRNFEFIPFGAGRRICPGMSLAIRMVNLMLASIIQPLNNCSVARL